MDEEVFLSALRQDPGDELTWSALADWLDDAGESERAELVRIGRRLRALSFEEGEGPRERARELADCGFRPVRLTMENSIGMRFVYVEAGAFLMGSPTGEAERLWDERQHEVRLTRPFWVGAYPVTQSQYERVVAINPSHFQGANRPVENVSWDDCVVFCRLLGESAEEKAHGRVYRLPTESEWEYACRGGAVFFSPLPFHFDEPSATLTSAQANFRGKHPYGDATVKSSREQTTDCGSFAPNALAIYDMHGNVQEWCADSDREYAAGPVSDPVGPPDYEWARVDRVFRGGSWGDWGSGCRAAFRGWSRPSYRDPSIGFRLAQAAY